MEHTITVTTVQRTKAVSNHHTQPSTQDKVGSPVVSQARRDFSPPPSNTPETPIPLCKLELQSLPVNVRKFANPAPLGLCAFALTAFLANCVALNVGGMKAAGVSMSLALSYGGLVQVLAGMWEMATGNTFGATTFCSFGAYWISFSLISTFDATDVTRGSVDPICQNELLMGLFMLGWCIFTTLMLLCTLKSDLAMFSLYFFMDMNYLLLGIAHIQCNSHGKIPVALERAGGIFGILAASSAWYNAFAAISDINNSFLIVPVGHFPWSTAAHLRRAKAKEV